MSGTELQPVVRHIQGAVADDDGVTDCVLLQRFTGGQEAAFAVLLRRHAPLVWGICRRALGNGHDAEDVFQAAFLVLLSKSSTTRWDRSIGRWLHEVATRLAREARAARARRTAHERQAARGSETNPVEDDDRESCILLDEELASLPEHYREPLRLCYLEGQTRQRAARQLNWSLRTLERRLAQGRELLRARLERRGVGPSSALLIAALDQSAATSLPAHLLTDTLGCVAARGATASIAASGLVAAALTGFGGATLKRGVLLLLLATAVIGLGVALVAEPAHRPAASPISSASDKQGGERLDRDGNPLPQRALARLGSLVLRHSGTIRTLALSPDGKVLACGADDHRIHLWDIETARELRSLDAGEREPLGLAFAPDGQSLAAADGKSVSLWRVKSGKLMRQFSADRHDSRCVAFDSTGRVIASGGLDCIGWPLSAEEREALWKKKDIQELSRRTVESQRNESGVHFWDVATGKERPRLGVGDHHGVNCVAFIAGDKAVLTGNTDQRLCLHDIATGKLRYEKLTRPGVSGGISFELSRDGKLVLVGVETPPGRTGRLLLMEAATGREVRRFTLPEDASTSFAFTPDNKALGSIASVGKVRLIDLATEKELKRFRSPAEDFTLQKILPDGKTALSSSGNSVRFWDLTTGRERSPHPGHQGRVWAVAFSPDGRTVLSLGASTVRRWEVSSGKQIARFNGHAGSVSPPPFALSGDGQTLAVLGNGFMDPNKGPDDVVRIWETATGKEQRRLLVPYGLALALSQDGKLLAASDGTDIRFWSEGKPLLTIPGKKPQGRARGIRGAEWQTFIADLVMSPDGRSFATKGSNMPVGLWSMAGRLRWETAEHNAQALAFSPDGAMLAVSSGGPIRVLEVATGKERLRLGQHESRHGALAFSPDGTRLASGSEDHTVRLWDVARGAGASAPGWASQCDLLPGLLARRAAARLGKR